MIKQWDSGNYADIFLEEGKHTIECCWHWKNIKTWIENACLAFKQLQNVLGSKAISLKVNLPFNIWTFLSTAWYTCQKRRATTNIAILQAVFFLSCLRKISKISCKDEVKSDKILRCAEVQTSKQHRGHILRRPVRWLIKVSRDWIPHAEKRASGRT